MTVLCTRADTGYEAPERVYALNLVFLLSCFVCIFDVFKDFITLRWSFFCHVDSCTQL